MIYELRYFYIHVSWFSLPRLEMPADRSRYSTIHELEFNEQKISWIENIYLI